MLRNLCSCTKEQLLLIIMKEDGNHFFQHYILLHNCHHRLESTKRIRPFVIPARNLSATARTAKSAKDDAMSALKRSCIVRNSSDARKISIVPFAWRQYLTAGKLHRTALLRVVNVASIPKLIASSATSVEDTGGILLILSTWEKIVDHSEARSANHRCKGRARPLIEHLNRCVTVPL